MSYYQASYGTDKNGGYEEISDDRRNSMASSSPFEFGGRSYVSQGIRSSVNSPYEPTVYSGNKIHEQTAFLANIGVTDDGDTQPGVDDSFDFHDNSQVLVSNDPLIASTGSFEDSVGPTEPYESNKWLSQGDSTPLMKKPSQKYLDTDAPYYYGTGDQHDYETGIDPTDLKSPRDTSLLTKYVTKPIGELPAVFLGTLLNILDGLSYGMIMFPVSEAVFSSLGSTGLSMFYMSCIVSQLVYSLGGSAFKSGIGSEMIEVTPFFHTMALSISSKMSGDSNEAIIATTITTYAISSIVTGLVFFLLGKLKLGALVGFFPRHILVGCIGGVGYFLIVTGIEVSSRLQGGLEYTIPTFKYLFFDYVTFLEWFVPLFLTIVLIVLESKFHNSLLVPLFFISVFLLFHLIVSLVPSWDLNLAREYGWVFPSVEGNEPWYGFYELYKFKLVNWVCILEQIPSMLALTFFGILHVPINVPALAVSVGMDQFDVDRELVAHGYSNVLSGLVGSIQNYLVYTNSVLFIRAGADDRLAGVLLAIATAGVMVVGPSIIGYIPVCVVGSLIYLLGYELLKESLFDTWGRLRKIEYCTVLIIVFTMGALDFVIGILVGILLACLSFVVEAARRPVVKGTYTGSVARSTVLRHPKQQEFLKDVGDQICIMKLQGTVFFGSIGGVEKAIRDRFADDKYVKHPIKFLILDMKGVDSIDFSAAEGFRRILNLLNEFNTSLIFSSVIEDDEIILALKDAGLWDGGNDIKLFGNLNYALEWCENSFLATYKRLKQEKKIGSEQLLSHDAGRKSIVGPMKSLMNQTMNFGTPRTTQVYQAAARTVSDEQRLQNKYYGSSDSSFKKQPLPLIMITLGPFSDKDEKFWTHLAPFFVKESIPENYTFYNSSQDGPAFFLVDSGLIKSIIRFESHERELHSSILPLTAFGTFCRSSHFRNVSYSTVNDSVVWKLTGSKFDELLKSKYGDKMYKELLQIESQMFRERFDTMTANLVLDA